MVATASSAAAAFTDCPNNFVCLFTGSNGTGSMWGINGTDLHDCRCLFRVPSGFTRPASSNNRTTGTACLYNIDATIVTNILKPQTKGNLRNRTADFIDICG
jgi:hypothetical protein